MSQDRVLTVYDCVRGSATAELSFPQILARLAAIGVERYYCDYLRLETTYYFADGDSIVASLPHERHEIGQEFAAATVEAAVRQSQRGEHTYADFVRKTTAAGCVGYMVYIAGRHVAYLGRRGEQHVERFPD
jgi:uncharacterized protein YbcV (DUF1398 family)